MFDPLSLSANVFLNEKVMLLIIGNFAVHYVNRLEQACVLYWL